MRTSALHKRLDRLEAAAVTKKVCRRCGQEKPIEAFVRHSRPGNPNYRTNFCRSCHNLKNNEGKDGEKKEISNRVQRTGFSSELFTLAKNLQGNACAICRVDFDLIPSNWAHADHDHTTGRLRGVLCSSCNVGLGHFKDKIPRLHAAIEYLKDPTLGFL